MTLNNEDLIAAIQQNGNLTSKAEAKRQLDNVRDTIIGLLERGAKDPSFDLRVYGFGIFKVAKVKAKTGRNPLTGKPLDVPARTKLKFSFTKSIADLGK